MITGYNTDVRHEDTVFHVQTEDKGTTNPFIESLVYVGGQVLASRRASYAELLGSDERDKEVSALMEKQHRVMIAAIRHGKFDERLAQLKAGGRPPARPGEGTGAEPAAAAAAPDAAATAPPNAAPPNAAPPNAAAPGAAQSAPPPPPPPPAAGGPRPVVEAGALASLAPPAAGAPRMAEAVDRSLDQVILDYLSSEADQEQLLLMLQEEARLGLGRAGALALRTASSKSGAPVPGAEVTVRMISTVGEPRTLAAGTTDESGLLRLEFDVPALGRGTAALIISAASGIGRAELKQLL